MERSYSSSQYTELQNSEFQYSSSDSEDNSYASSQNISPTSLRQSMSAASLLAGIDLAISQYLKSEDYSATLAMFVSESDSKQIALDYSNNELLEYLFIPESNDYLYDELTKHNIFSSEDESDQVENPLLPALISVAGTLEKDGFLTQESVNYISQHHGMSLCF